jgi:hypothetical protein
MSKIYIFGDSFFCRWVETGREYGWIYQLAQKYFVVDAAQPGASNYEIYLNFLKYVNNITPEDTVILGWSDPSRFYVNSGISKNEKIYELYYKNFYNSTLSTLYQKTIMNEIKRIIKEKNIKALFFWSFPSDYIEGPKERTNWLDAILSNIDVEKYQYLDTFENEVKPALIYFSKKELVKFSSETDIITYFRDIDVRPNHMGSKRLHNELVTLVSEFVTNQKSGQIDLIKRLTNGT